MRRLVRYVDPTAAAKLTSLVTGCDASSLFDVILANDAVVEAIVAARP